jgi:multiple antibiotic resistance protein
MVSELLTFSLAAFTGLFAMMNPISITQLFLGLVEGRSKISRNRIAKKGCITAFFIVTFFLILGKYLFELYGITIPAFKITGGILLFYIGFEMLQSKTSKIQHQEDVESDVGVAVSPLAIPMLAGPGTVVTAMNNVTDAGMLKIGILVVIVFVILFLNYLAFILSEYVINILGNNLIAVIGKIMGLILAIMGTGMVIRGINLAFEI